MADTPKSKNIKMSEILTSEQMKLTYIYKETDARISTHYTYPSKENLIPENKRCIFLIILVIFPVSKSIKK